MRKNQAISNNSGLLYLTRRYILRLALRLLYLIQLILSSIADYRQRLEHLVQHLAKTFFGQYLAGAEVVAVTATGGDAFRLGLGDPVDIVMTEWHIRIR